MADQRAGGISWTDQTWNPIRGCSRVSEGCRNCYAEHVAARFSDPGRAYEGLARRTPAGPRWTGEVRLVEEHLADPLRWTRPRRIFVNSMSDLFHEQVEDEWIDRMFAVMAQTPHHTYQILTKRPERMLSYCAAMAALAPKDRSRRVVASMYRGHPAEYLVRGGPPDERCGDFPWPLPNVHLCVSVEDQPTADARIPILLQTPAAVRGVSYEPALGPVRFEDAWMHHYGDGPPGNDLDRGLDWIVVGGESGHGARPFDLAWARATIAQGRAAGVPVFVKQLGARPIYCSLSREAHHVDPTICHPMTFRDRKGGDWSEWPEDLRVREFPG